MNLINLAFLLVGFARASLPDLFGPTSLAICDELVLTVTSKKKLDATNVTKGIAIGRSDRTLRSGLLALLLVTRTLLVTNENKLDVACKMLRTS